MIEKETKFDMDKQLEQLEKCLNKIGWGIRGNDRNRRIFNHKNEGTDWEVRGDRIELHNDETFGKGASENGMAGNVTFYLADCSIEMINDGCVSVGVGDRAYILFYNHTIKRLKKTKKEEADLPF